MSAKPLPCPFCHADGSLEYVGQETENELVWRVECSRRNCWNGPDLPTEDEAVASWNSVASLLSRLERLEAALVIARSAAYCENLSHTKRDQHRSGEPCPVEERFRAALDAQEEETKTT